VTTIGEQATRFAVLQKLNLNRPKSLKDLSA
jgi:hypothetical protein